MTPIQELAQVIAAIEKDFPDWDVFRSAAGRFWALDRKITHQQVLEGCRTTAHGDTPEELRSELVLQQQKRDKLAASCAGAAS